MEVKTRSPRERYGRIQTGNPGRIPPAFALFVCAYVRIIRCCHGCDACFLHRHMSPLAVRDIYKSPKGQQLRMILRTEFKKNMGETDPVKIEQMKGRSVQSLPYKTVKSFRPVVSRPFSTHATDVSDNSFHFTASVLLYCTVAHMITDDDVVGSTSPAIIVLVWQFGAEKTDRPNHIYYLKCFGHLVLNRERVERVSGISCFRAAPLSLALSLARSLVTCCDRV